MSDSRTSDDDLIDCLCCPFCGASDLTVSEISTDEIDNGYVVAYEQCYAAGPITLTRLNAQEEWNRSIPRD